MPDAEQPRRVEADRDEHHRELVGRQRRGNQRDADRQRDAAVEPRDLVVGVLVARAPDRLLGVDEIGRRRRCAARAAPGRRRRPRRRAAGAPASRRRASSAATRRGSPATSAVSLSAPLSGQSGPAATSRTRAGSTVRSPRVREQRRRHDRAGADGRHRRVRAPGPRARRAIVARSPAIVMPPPTVFSVCRSAASRVAARLRVPSRGSQHDHVACSRRAARDGARARRAEARRAASTAAR